MRASVVGSYDHTVKLFDQRSPDSVLTVDHGCPVECVLMYPGGGLFLSAGESTNTCLLLSDNFQSLSILPFFLSY